MCWHWTEQVSIAKLSLKPLLSEVTSSPTCQAETQQQSNTLKCFSALFRCLCFSFLSCFAAQTIKSPPGSSRDLFHVIIFSLKSNLFFTEQRTEIQIKKGENKHSANVSVNTHRLHKPALLCVSVCGFSVKWGGGLQCSKELACYQTYHTLSFTILTCLSSEFVQQQNQKPEEYFRNPSLERR